MSRMRAISARFIMPMLLRKLLQAWYDVSSSELLARSAPVESANEQSLLDLLNPRVR